MKLEDLVQYVEYVKYKVATLQVVLNDETIDIPQSFVSEILIEHDYDNLHTPILTLSVALTQTEYKKIVEQKATVKFIVSLNRMFYNNKRKLLYYDNYFNKTFCTHILDETPMMEQDLVEMTRNVTKSTEESASPMELRDVYDFALFVEQYITAGNKDINMVVKTGTVNDIMTYLLRFSGLNKVLMTPANNKKRLSNFLCPLMNIVEAFKYVQEMEGIYNKGLLFFMDFNDVYLIDKSAYCTAWKPNEYKITNVYIFSQKSDFNSIVGQMIDEEQSKNNVFTNSESTDVTNKSVVNNAIYGNKTVLINSKTGGVSYIDQKLKQRGASQTNLAIEKNSNSYAINSTKLRQSENEYDVKIILKDVDLSVLSPNKCFKLIFQNTELNDIYGGTYRISKSLTTMTKMGEELNPSTICEFKKQNDKTNEFGDEDRFDDWESELG